MQLNFKFKTCLFMAAMAGLLTVSCSKGDKNADSAGKEEEAPLVKIETVHNSNVAQKGVYTSSVDADLINNISSSTPNRIREILVDEGMMVQKGQKLVVLDDINIVSYESQINNAKAGVESAQSGVANAQAGVDNAQAGVNNAQANFNNVQLNYNRAVELYKIGGGTKQNVDAMETQLITARNSLNTAKSALTSAKSQLEAAKSGLSSAQSTLAAAERALANAQENTVLTAPISGVVTKRNYDPGDMTGQLPILTIANVQPVKVVCNISESEYAKVSKGMKVVCTFDTYGDKEFDGTVSMVSPTIDTSSRTFGVEVTLPNPNNQVLPGMFGRVNFNFGEETHVVVPDKAVVKQPGSGDQYVYVYKDGKVSYNKVQLGQRLGSSYEILSGLADGDEVVVSGQSKLANGMAVRVQK